MSPKSLLLASLVGAALATPAAGEPLTFERALARAQSAAPNLQAATLQVQAARSAAAAAGALPDPRLTLGVDNFPVSGPNAGRFGEEEMTMATVGLMQEFPNRARKRAEAAIARAEVGIAQVGVVTAQREARQRTALAWVDLYFAEHRLAALDEVLGALGPIWSTAPSALTSGESRPAMALAPVRMRAELQDMRSELVAARGKARAELARWTGDPSPSAEGRPPEPSIDEAALRSGLDQLPAIQSYSAASDRARAAVDLAKSEKRPDWAVEVSYGRRDPMFGDMVSAGVSVRLPIFAGRRQEPVIVARTAESARIVAERENARREVSAAFEGDLADHLMHHDQWLRARDEVLPAARQQADLETASYAAGRAGLSEVLDALTALAQARLTALEREAAVVRDAIRINFTYGSAGQ